MRRAHELRFSLEVTLATNLRLGAFGGEDRLVINHSQLITIGSLYHDGMTVHAGYASAGVWTRFPIGLNAALMTAQARFVLNLGGLTRIFAKCEHATDALAATRSDVITTWSVAAFTNSFFRFVARIVQENFAHQRAGKTSL